MESPAFRYPTKEQVIEANRESVKISGDPFGVLNPGTLEFAVSAVGYKYNDKPREEALLRKASFLLEVIAGTGHIFLEGNKRTGVAVTLSFLERNGVTILSLDQYALAGLALAVARGEASQNAVYRWLRERIKLPAEGKDT